MTVRQFLLLLIPSMLWGSSFIFFKELSPIYGPLLTSAIRILFAGLFMWIFFVVTKRSLDFKNNFMFLLIVGILNSAIPFTLYAYAALYIPSSLSVIINSTSPMFGALLGVFVLHEKLSLQKMLGLILGIVGVGIVSSFVFIEGNYLLYLSILACLVAALMYGIAGVYVKKVEHGLDPYQLTFGSLSFAGIGMIILYVILIPFHVNPEILSTNLWLEISMLVLFGVLCTSIPYIIYYKLIMEIGPVKALTVTYLMPVFGIVWSLIYGEEFRFVMVLGLVVILIGIYVISNEKKVN